MRMSAWAEGAAAMLPLAPAAVAMPLLVPAAEVMPLLAPEAAGSWAPERGPAQARMPEAAAAGDG